MKIYTCSPLDCDRLVQAFGGKGMNGVMTYLFTKTIKEHAGITYGGFLEKMHDEIEKVYQSKCYRILKRICHRKLEQVGFHLLCWLLLLRVCL